MHTYMEFCVLLGQPNMFKYVLAYSAEPRALDRPKLCGENQVTEALFRCQKKRVRYTENYKQYASCFSKEHT